MIKQNLLYTVYCGLESIRQVYEIFFELKTSILLTCYITFCVLFVIRIQSQMEKSSPLVGDFLNLLSYLLETNIATNHQDMTKAKFDRLWLVEKKCLFFMIYYHKFQTLFLSLQTFQITSRQLYFSQYFMLHSSRPVLVKITEVTYFHLES